MFGNDVETFKNFTKPSKFNYKKFIKHHENIAYQLQPSNKEEANSTPKPNIKFQIKKHLFSKVTTNGPKLHFSESKNFNTIQQTMNKSHTTVSKTTKHRKLLTINLYKKVEGVMEDSF